MAPGADFPGNIFFYLLFVGFAAFFIYAAAYKLRPLFAAKPVSRLDNLPKRTLTALWYVVLNWRLLTNRRFIYSGFLHSLIFWGFIALQIRTLNFLLNGVHEDASLQSIFGIVYTGFRPVMELFDVLVILGVGMAASQRLVWRPSRLTLNWDAWVILGLIGTLMATDVVTNSFDIALERGGKDAFSFWAFGMANLWDRVGLEGQALEGLHTTFWYLHLINFLLFLCYLPFSKHSHVLTVAFNVFLRSLKPTGYLAPIRDFETAEVFGAGKPTDFVWKQLLDSYTCTECGRCTAVCPANLTDKLLSPKHVIYDIRKVMERQLPPLLPIAAASAGGNGDGEKPNAAIEGVGFEPIWDCVTCGACMQACPVFIEHVPTILDMRRYLVMTEANMPETAQATLMQLEQRGHPWRGTTFTRTTWIEQMGVDVPRFTGEQEYLYWVGCTGALVDRNIPITQALARLLMEAGVSFGVLGEEESCSGDPARRLGNEYLYQLQAQQVIETLKAKGVQKIITTCPHCFNTFKNEYPDFEGRFQVFHHTEVLAELVRQGRLKPQKQLDFKSITFHDPCYLARHNGVLEPPRQVLQGLPGAEMVEMPRNRLNSFCCGAGGGHMWVEENRGKHINHERTEEAVSTGAQVVATACPFCVQMFEDGIPSVQPDESKRMRALDVAELLELSLATRPAKAETVGADGEGS